MNDLKLGLAKSMQNYEKTNASVSVLQFLFHEFSENWFYINSKEKKTENFSGV